MKIIFLGIGPACDENYPNNSQIVISNKINLLVDCGYSVPTQFWRHNSNPNFLDAIYISHQHADHFFGLPALLLRMWEDGREKDVTIICQKELRDSFEEFMGYAYKGFLEKFKYKINFIESKNGGNLEFGDLNLSFCKTAHSGENLAIRISNFEESIIYSGDGSPLDANFYKNTDILVQETFLYNEEKEGHASIVFAIKFAEDNNIKTLALTHMSRNFRKNELPKLRDKIIGSSQKVKIIIPEPLEEYDL